jgi:copper chaperone
MRRFRKYRAWIVVAVRLDEAEAEVEGSAGANALIAAIEEEGYKARVA